MSLVIGPVRTEKETNLPGKGKGQRKYANQIDETRCYDIAKYVQDFKAKFPSISNVGLCPLPSHISTEVDCESHDQFSQAGLYEQHLVEAKHQLHHIHCPISKVK